MTDAPKGSLGFSVDTNSDCLDMNVLKKSITILVSGTAEVDNVKVFCVVEFEQIDLLNTMNRILFFFNNN